MRAGHLLLNLEDVQTVYIKKYSSIDIRCHFTFKNGNAENHVRITEKQVQKIEQYFKD